MTDPGFVPPAPGLARDREETIESVVRLLIQLDAAGLRLALRRLELVQLAILEYVFGSIECS